MLTIWLTIKLYRRCNVRVNFHCYQSIQTLILLWCSFFKFYSLLLAIQPVNTKWWPTPGLRFNCQIAWSEITLTFWLVYHKFQVCQGLHIEIFLEYRKSNSDTKNLVFVPWPTQGDYQILVTQFLRYRFWVWQNCWYLLPLNFGGQNKLAANILPLLHPCDCSWFKVYDWVMIMVHHFLLTSYRKQTENNLKAKSNT